MQAANKREFEKLFARREDLHYEDIYKKENQFTRIKNLLNKNRRSTRFNFKLVKNSINITSFMVQY